MEFTTLAPPMGEPVMIMCEHFECLGYLDKDGLWRSWFTDVQLVGVIEWRPLEMS